MLHQPERTRAPLLFQVRVGAEPALLFEAFFSWPERWLCRQATMETRVGGRLRWCWPDGCVEGELLQYQRPTVARWNWRADPSLPPTLVVVALAPMEAPGGRSTVLTLEHYGFGVGPSWDALYVGAARAWGSYLKNLRAVVEMGVDLREPDE